MKIILLLLAICFANIHLLAQLNIEPGTRWVSDNATDVTLDELGVRIDADASAFSNTFRFTGAGDANIQCSPAGKFGRLVIDKPGHQLHLKSDIYVLRALEFKTGLINLNNRVLVLDPAATLVNESENSRLIDAGNGAVIISTVVTTPIAVNPGNIGAIFSSSVYSGILRISRKHAPLPITSTYNSISRAYAIYTEDKGGINATLRLHYFDAEASGMDENNLVIWKKTFEGESVSIGAASRDTGLNFVEQNGLNSFGTFTLAGDVEPPVTALDPSSSTTFIVSVYPTRSVDGQIFIEAGKTDVNAMQVQILDMSGRQLLNESLPYQSQWLTLPGGSSGMNIIRIQSGRYRYHALFTK